MAAEIAIALFVSIILFGIAIRYLRPDLIGRFSWSRLRGSLRYSAGILPSQADYFQATKGGGHGDYRCLVLAPWSVQELYDGTIRAFNLAERYRTVVFVMAEAATTHLQEEVDVAPEVTLYERDKAPGVPPFGCEAPDGVPPMPAFGEGEKLLVTASTHDARGFRRTSDPLTHRVLTSRLHNKIMMHVPELARVEEHFLDDAEYAFVAYGFTARSALSAVRVLRLEGMKVGLLRLQTLWPFPVQQVAALGERVRSILVPEMNLGQMVHVVSAAARCPVVLHAQMDGTVIYPQPLVESMRRLMA